MDRVHTQPRVACLLCGAQILEATAASTGGLCSPCFRAANWGRTPANLKYIETRGLSAIEDRWRRFERRSFPRGLAEEEVAGVCVITLDLMAAGCVSAALAIGERDSVLDGDRIENLRSCIPALESVVENLQGDAREYFDEMLWLARAVLNVCDGGVGMLTPRPTAEARSMTAKKVRRIHVFGASGSGTTELGHALADTLGCQHLDTDTYLWLPTDPPYQMIRERAKRQALLLRELEHRGAWVLSGSLCEWGDFAIPLFDLAVFLWLPTEVRMERLRRREIERRGPDIENPSDPRHHSHMEFLEWAGAYDTGGLDMRSRALHENWISALSCPVVRIEEERSLPENLMTIMSEIMPHGVAGDGA
jgi:adenylate kinase family enzyme